MAKTVNTTIGRTRKTATEQRSLANCAINGAREEQTR
jgi:hypothetical protein